MGTSSLADVETDRISFPSRDNHRLHPPIHFAMPYSTWSTERWSPGALPQELSEASMISTEKKVDLQFAMEATKCEPLTFEEYLAVILLHMFLLGNESQFSEAVCKWHFDIRCNIWCGCGLNTQWRPVQELSCAHLKWVDPDWCYCCAFREQFVPSSSALDSVPLESCEFLRLQSIMTALWVEWLLARLNLTFLSKNCEGSLMWCNGNCVLWVSTVFSMRSVWADGDACHEHNGFIVQRCSGWICLTATGHTLWSSFHYGHWLRDWAPA